MRGRSSRTGGSAVWRGASGPEVWDTESLTPARGDQQSGRRGRKRRRRRRRWQKKKKRRRVVP